MKDLARVVMNFLISYGDLIYVAVMLAIVLILVFSAVSAHKGRGALTYEKKQKPLSSKDFFHESFSRGGTSNDEDYLRYREDFVVEEDEDSFTHMEYLVEVYGPKLIKGCAVSLVLMALVAAPYLVIANFA